VKGMIMPAMPRYDKKAIKIVRDLIGAADNQVDQETKKQKKMKKWLLYEEGQWVR
jgi:hypothetical protein